MTIYKDITDLHLSGSGLCGYIFKGADPLIALSLASEFLHKLQFLPDTEWIVAVDGRGVRLWESIGPMSLFFFFFF